MLDGGMTQPEWVRARGIARVFFAFCMVLGLGVVALAQDDAPGAQAAAVEDADAPAQDDALARAEARLAVVEQEVQAIAAEELRLRRARGEQSREYSRLMQVAERRDPKVQKMKAQIRETRAALALQQRELDDYLRTLPDLKRWSESQQADSARMRETPQRRMDLLREMARLRHEIQSLQQGDADPAQRGPRIGLAPAHVETAETTTPDVSD